jgi:transposase
MEIMNHQKTLLILPLSAQHNGYSKDKRNDIKQIMTGMVTDGDGLIRFGHVLDGNTADCKYNHLMITDSKMLNKKNLNLISRLQKKFALRHTKNKGGKNRNTGVRHLNDRSLAYHFGFV